jgi:ribosomal subunit interface protein
MSHIEIDFNSSFEKSLASVLSLPDGRNPDATKNEFVADALRELYALAHGRTVQTSIGPVRIGPPIDPSLRDAPIRVSGRAELMALAKRLTKFIPSATADSTRQSIDESQRTGRDKFPVHITSHNVRLGPALREFIQRKISAVRRIAGDALGVELVLRGASDAPHLFSVTARVALPGPDLHGSASHHNIRHAITDLVARLARAARKRKTRLSKGRRGQARRSATHSPARSLLLVAL